MRYSLQVVAAFGLLTGAFAAPAAIANSKRHVVHEKRDRVPSNWSKEVKLEGDSFLPMRIALTQNNLDKADEFLLDVSHPSSPNFGKHWTAKQVAETFAPTKEAVDSVIAWLADSGVATNRVKQSQSLNWIHVNVTVAEAESLLQTEYYGYTHDSTGQVHVACEQYSLPEEIQQHVDFVTPTLHFDAKLELKKKKRAMDTNEVNNLRKRKTPTAGAAKQIGSPNDGSLPKQGATLSVESLVSELENCDESIVPECLRALYLLPADFPVADGNSYGIVEYSPQAYLGSDLDIFFSNFSPSLVGSRPEFNSIDGGVLQTIVESFNYNGESDLDLEYAMTLVAPQNVTLYQVGDIEEGASFNNFLDALDESYCTYDGGDDPNQDGVYPDPYGNGTYFYEGPEACGGFAAAKVISTSYGYNEADLTPFYETRQCNEYMKLGLQGTTFLYSSGDYGVAGNGGQCIDLATDSYNDGTNGTFNPAFPGTCPYVTSVGATQVKVNATVTQPEEAAESVIYSGGGFSNVFAAPSWQTDALATYFADHLPPYTSEQYNNSQTTRGYPDVSANGVNYVIAIDGEFSYVYGTSASSPTFGSVLTLINAARLDVGKSSIGFINPVLYAEPGILNDITSGGNQGCGTDGFTAVKGWDPVTGLGTPNFPLMLAYWLLLP